jgi:hypothetical protein
VTEKSKGCGKVWFDGVLEHICREGWSICEDCQKITEHINTTIQNDSVSKRQDDMKEISQEEEKIIKVFQFEQGIKEGKKQGKTNFSKFVEELKENLMESKSVIYVQTNDRDGVWDIIQTLANKYMGEDLKELEK